MISMWFALKGFIDDILQIWVALAVAFGFGVLGASLRLAWGALGAGLVSAVGMGIVLLMGWAGDDDARLAALRAEMIRLEAKNLELKLTGEQHEKLIKRLGEAAVFNEQKMSDLKDLLDSVADNKDCDLPEDYRDAINSLR